jgi:phosphoribosylanthranilate isomerase
MSRVMICGLRRDSDVQMLVDQGIDAIGLITEVRQDIPCVLRRTDAKRLAMAVAPFIASVLVITEEDPDEIVRLTDFVGPNVVQLHGFNRPEDVAALRARLKVRMVKALHFSGGKMIEAGEPEVLAAKYIDAGADAILVDSASATRVGSTGKLMDLELAKTIRDTIYPSPLILAGGLNARNVQAAIEKVRPYAVDVFSGVTSDGYLDAKKVNEFVSTVRSTGNGPEARYVTGR